MEIDELVVEVCRKYLPQTACRLDDPRVHIHYEDGLKYIRSCENEYDLILGGFHGSLRPRGRAVHPGVLRELF